MDELIAKIYERNSNSDPHIPDRYIAEEFINKLFYALFGNLSNKINNKAELESEFKQLEVIFSKLIFSEKHCNTDNNFLWSHFEKELSQIYESSLLDATAILETDPAAESLEEVILAYPGFYAIAIHRVSHFFYNEKETLLARIFSELIHSKTGIDIHPGARIGQSFAIDHGTGIVIGETTVIGDRVKIYQGVTLGALSVSKKQGYKKRHPTIGNDVIIYGNATILGGNTVIGDGSIIGGNVWLTESVAPNSTVFQKSEVKIKNNDNRSMDRLMCITNCTANIYPDKR